MSDPFFTLAAWSVFESRWVAFQTSRREEFIRASFAQAGAIFFCPLAVVEVPEPGTDDDVMRAVGDLPAPAGFDDKAGYRALELSLEMGRFHDQIHPPGDPNR